MDREPVSIGGLATTQLGKVWVAASEHGLTTVEYGVERAQFEASLRRQHRRETSQASAAARQMIDAAACQIAEYLQGRRRVFELPIDWLSLTSEFQRVALGAVMAIPYGEIRTYGQIAAGIGCPRAPRAVDARTPPTRCRWSFPATV